VGVLLFPLSEFDVFAPFFVVGVEFAFSIGGAGDEFPALIIGLPAK
jgi:hypothetical protein